MRRHGISRRRLMRIVKLLPGRRLVVIGDWMLDRYVWGTASRLSPEAAVPVVDFVEESEALGGAGNVAFNLAALRAKVVPFGVVGRDLAGEALLERLRGLGVLAAGIIAEAARPTTIKTRIIARHQQIVRVDREVRAPISAKTEDKLVQQIIGALRSADGAIISDYDKGVVTDALAGRILQAARRLGVPVFVKPKWSRLPAYRGVTTVVCNRAEAGFLAGRSMEDDESVEGAARALLAHFACASVVITRGEQGMSVFEHDGEGAAQIAATSQERHYGQRNRDQNRGGRQVFDVTGAGDTVLATLALAVAAGASVLEGAVLGNAAAGVVVGKLGTACVSPDELLAALREVT